MVITASLFFDDFLFMTVVFAGHFFHHESTTCPKGFKSFWMLFFVIFVTFVVNKSVSSIWFYIHNLDVAYHLKFAGSDANFRPRALFQKKLS